MAQTRAVINIEVNTSDAAAQLRTLQTQVNSFAATLSRNNLVQAEASQRFSERLMDATNASRFFTAEQVRMETSARRLDQTLSKGRGTLSQYFSAKFKKDSAEAAAVLSLANSRAQALQTTFFETAAASRGFRDTIAVRPLAAFNTEAAVASEKLAIHRAMLRQATTSMINFGKNTQWAGRQLMVGFTVPLTIFGGAAAKTFKEIDQAAVRFKKVYGDAFTTPVEIEQNMKAVEGLALEFTKYGIAVSDTITLAAEAAAAGAKNESLIAATTESTRLATLGQMDQNEALAATIALQNAFRLSNEQLATEVNFLNMVENQTVVTLQDLAEAIPRVAPVIVGLGGNVRDMAAFMAAMQEGGVSAAQGANALKSGLGSLINPTEKASNTLKDMGINLNAIVQANRGNLMGTVTAFAKELAKLDQFTRQQALEELFGKYQYARLGALFDNIIKDGTQASRVLQLAGMSAQDMAKSAERELSVISEATSTKYAAAMERFKLAIAPIGEMFMKIATPIMNFFSKLFEMFDKLPDGVKNFAAIATVIVGVVIPAGTMFLGLIMNLLGTLAKFSSVIVAAIAGLGKGGFAGAIQAVSQTLGYMSLEEIDAATAANQLGSATRNANAALLAQVTNADRATAAFSELAIAIRHAAKAQETYAATYPLAFAPGAAASSIAKRGPQPFRPVKRNAGGTIPGFGNKDTVPAMLTPGEFVINKQATEKHLPLLYAINNGGEMPGFNKGGGIAKNGRMFYGRYPRPNRKINLDLEGMPDGLLKQRLLEVAGTGKSTLTLPTQSTTTAQEFMTLPQLSTTQRETLNNALQNATPQLKGVDAVQLMSNLVGAGPSFVNQQARYGRASSEDMAMLTGLVDFYLPTFRQVPSAQGALSNLGIDPMQAAERLASVLAPKFKRLGSISLRDQDIYDEVAQGFADAGMSSVYSALSSDRNAIRYTLPTELVSYFRRILPGNSVHDTLLQRAFPNPGQVRHFRDSENRPGYVVEASALGLPKDLLLMPGLTYSTGTGMKYEDIAVAQVQGLINSAFGGRNLTQNELKVIRMHLGKNKGGMIPGVQYFAKRFPSRLVKSFLDFIRRTPGPRTATDALNPKDIISGLTKPGLTRQSVQTRLDRQYYVPTTGHGQRARSLSALVPKSTKTRNEQEVENAIQTALSAGWISEEDVQHLRGIETFNSMKRTDLAHREAATIVDGNKIFTASEVMPRPGLENLGIQYLFGSGRSREIFERLVNDKSNARFKKRYASEIKRIIDDKGHPQSKRDYEFLDELFKRLYKSKDEKIIEWINQPQLTQSRWLPLVRGLVYNKKRDKKFKRSETLYEEVSKIMNANSGGMIPGVQYLTGAGIVRRPDMKAITSTLVQRRAEVSVAKGRGIRDLIFSRDENDKLNLDASDLFTLLTNNHHITDEQVAQIAKYHGSRIRGGIFGKFDPEVGYKVRDPKQQTWRDIAQLLKERGYPVVQQRNNGGIISGIQYLFGGGPAIGATLRRLLSNRQRKILAAEPDQTLESAARQYADYGYSRLSPAQRVLLSQSREPFVGPQLFRGTGGSSPLIDRKLRDRLARGSYTDIIDLEGEMIQFPKGSWSTDERIAYDHMKYYASENQEWIGAIDALTVRGSVPLYGSTYKEHIKGEQANVITRIKELKSQLKRAQDKISPEVVAQEEAKLEQLRLAVEQERKNVMSKYNFSEDQSLSLVERAFIRGEVDKSKAQADYRSAQQSHKFNLEHPSKIQEQIDEQILSLYYKRNKRKQAFAEIERLRQQGANVQVFFKATKSDRYVPPGEARISYIQDLTKDDPNDPLTTRFYTIGLDMGYPEMVDISGGPGARYGGKTNEYEYIRQNKGGIIPVQNFNTGGMADPIKAFNTGKIFESASKPIVPGVGNTDTVPAALTPGEFVINKQATAKNLPLLRAINNGGLEGFNSGGMIGELLYLGDGSKNPISPFSPQALYPSNPLNNPVVQTDAPVDVNIKEVSGENASRTGLGRLSKLGMAGNVAGMGMMMAPMMIPQIAENPAASTGLMAAGMGMQFLEPLMMMMSRGGAGVGAGEAASATGLARFAMPLLTNPYTAAIAAAAAAVSAGLIIWRKNIDDTSIAMGEMGANLGVTSGALDNMAKMLGMQTPAQRQAKFNFAFTPEQTQLAQEISPYFQSEEGQKFINDLKEATGEKRIKKLSDYVRSAVASEMMDKTAAAAFAKSVADALGDQNLGIQIARQIKSQDTGADALLNLAKERVAGANKNMLIKQAIMASGEPRSISTAAAGAAAGASIEIISDYANVVAKAKEELMNGTITFRKYHEIIQEVSTQQEIYSNLLKKSLTGSQEQGGTRQAIRQSLVAKGYTEDQLTAIEHSIDIGRSTLNAPQFLVDPTSAVDNFLRGSTAFTRQAATNRMTEAGKPLNERNFAQQILADTTKRAYQLMGVKNVPEATGLQGSILSFAMGGIGDLGTETQDMYKNFEEEAKVSQEKFVKAVDNGLEAQLYTAVASGEMTAESAAQFATALADGSKQATLALDTLAETNSVEMAALRYNVESGAVAGLNTDGQRLSYMQGARNFKEAGFNMTDYQNVMSSVGTTNVGELAIQIKGMTLDEVTKLVEQTSSLNQLIGPEGSRKVMDVLVNENPPNLTDRLPEITKSIEDLQKNVPDDVLKQLNIDVTNVADMDKYGPLANDLGNLSEILASFPSEIREIGIDFMLDENGNPVTPNQFGKSMKIVKKAYEDLGSLDQTVEKKAILKLLQSIEGEGGKTLNADQAAQAYQSLIKKYGKKKIYKLPPDIALKVFKIQVKIEGLKESIALYKKAIAALHGEGENLGGLVGHMNDQLAKLEELQNEQDALMNYNYDSAGGAGGGGGGGGGAGQKSILQELKDQLKQLKDIYAGMKQFLNSQTGLFKGLMAGPFAPQFIEYLKSQGDRGIKLLKDGGDKLKKAYAVFIDIQRQTFKNTMQSLPSTINASRQQLAGKNALQNALERQGFDKSSIDMFMQQPGIDVTAQEYQRVFEKSKRVGKKGLTKEEKSILKERNQIFNVDNDPRQGKRIGMIFKQTKRLTQEQRSQTLENMKDTNKLNSLLTNTLSGKGISSEVIDILKDMGYTTQEVEKNMDGVIEKAKQLDAEVRASKFNDAMKGLKTDTQNAEQAFKIFMANFKDGKAGISSELATQMASVGITVDNTQAIQAFKETYDYLETLKLAIKGPLELQADLESVTRDIARTRADLDIETQLSDEKEKLKDLEKQNSEYSRRIELMNREYEALDDREKLLNESKENINKYYDDQLEALDAIQKKEEDINAIRQGQLDVASALSRGDIAGAAQSALQLQQTMAARRDQNARDAIEKSRKEELSAIDDELNNIKKEREKIETRIKNLTLEQRGIQDQIYDTNKKIADETERIERAYGVSESRVASLNAQLATQLKLQQDIQKAIGIVNTGGGTSGGTDGTGGGNQAGGNTSGSTPTATRAEWNPPQFSQNSAIAEIQRYIYTAQWNAENGARGFTSDYSIARAMINTAKRLVASIKGSISSAAWNALNNAYEETNAKITAAGYNLGGSVKYKGSKEQAPGMMFGGIMKKYAFGSLVPGRGMTDKVPAMLTPGEFVVRKSVAKNILPQLQQLNGQIYQNGFNVPSLIEDRTIAKAPMINTSAINTNTFPRASSFTPQSNVRLSSPINSSNNSTSGGQVQYNYTISVNAETNANPQDIANQVMYQIKRVDDRRIKGIGI